MINNLLFNTTLAILSSGGNWKSESTRYPRESSLIGLRVHDRGRVKGSQLFEETRIEKEVADDR